MNEELIKAVTSAYEANFGGQPLLVRAPGRINLIGEHTDYNNGFVLPAAVAHATYFAIGKSEDAGTCKFISLDMDQQYEVALADIKPLEQGAWQNYVMGVVSELQKRDKTVEGFNLVFSGDVPRGSGMSSSAALECGVCFGLNELFGFGLERVAMAQISQKAEHNYAGVMCGIMDQFASLMGKQDEALLLDCESLEFRHFPIVLEDYTLVLCNSNVSHSLASSEYNVRRQQCEEGVSIINEKLARVDSLRDVTLEQLDACKEEMSEVVFRRCKYILEENKRVETMTKAMENGDLEAIGGILKRAQQGMRDEYEISCPEIDFMADFANSREDVLGARMMGGGFGGCTINLVKAESEEAFIADLNAAYQQKFDKSITPISVKISDGVQLINQVQHA
ncbi:galactokinase [Marinoscillum furvescens]|uniref:Galactokinase n=1 Tax=Marinoscillum furvescens DSM 4134 TaxID=1122208 RepID=A0A3D9L6Q3_MARFU|nr:galactokinase [Marinoscillum furvescens]REE01154.1 galactokinase [Marinoscillum furvescens DSM 4134]